MTDATTSIAPIAITRKADRRRLGTIEIQEPGFLARRDAWPETRRTPAHTQEHATLEDAIAWVRASPLLPDLNAFPFHQGVYGPVLLELPQCKVVGKVAFSGIQAYECLGHEWDRRDLVVIDARNWVCGFLRQRETDWRVRVWNQLTHTTVMGNRKTCTAAVRFLMQACVSQFHAALTGHDRLALQVRTTTLAADVEAFFATFDQQKIHFYQRPHAPAAGP